MKPIGALIAIAALGMAMLACTFTFNSQVQGVTIVSSETSVIEVPAPDSNETTKVKLEFGVGELNINPGADGSIVSGALDRD